MVRSMGNGRSLAGFTSGWTAGGSLAMVFEAGESGLECVLELFQAEERHLRLGQRFGNFSPSGNQRCSH